MIELKGDALEFSFPEVHPKAKCRIAFQRTLRIPADGREYDLPAGLGRFPLRNVDEHSGRIPKAWRKRGGVMLPMHQAEALWIQLDGHYPMAVRVSAGRIDALTGKKRAERLERKPQNYAVIPDQPWLDGFAVGKGRIRQFVAAPLGEGLTAEEQLTGEAGPGGIHIEVTPIRARRWRKIFEERADELPRVMACMPDSAPGMGLGAGGLMRQEIYADEHGLKAWSRKTCTAVRIRIANSADWLRITGEEPPTEPPTTKQYADAGLPWFEYYGGDKDLIEGSKAVAKIKGATPPEGKKKPKGVGEPRTIKLGRKRRVRGHKT